MQGSPAGRVFVDPTGRRARVVRRMTVILVLAILGGLLLLAVAVSITPRVPPRTVGPRPHSQPHLSTSRGPA